MASVLPEQLDNLADEVGVALSEVEWRVRELFNDVNFGPDLDEDGEKNLRRLMQVRDLLEIATELYPYPYGEDRQ